MKQAIQYRVAVELAAEMKAAAVEEGFVQVAPFVRELTKWAFQQYTHAGSLFLLKKSKLEVPRWKVPRWKP